MLVRFFLVMQYMEAQDFAGILFWWFFAIYELRRMALKSAFDVGENSTNLCICKSLALLRSRSAAI